MNFVGNFFKFSTQKQFNTKIKNDFVFNRINNNGNGYTGVMKKMNVGFQRNLFNYSHNFSHFQSAYSISRRYYSELPKPLIVDFDQPLEERENYGLY